MARRRYYYRRIVRPKQKWAINTAAADVASTSSFTIGQGHEGTIGVPVCTNSSRIEASASSLTSSAQILKTGRWKFKGTIANATAAVGYIFYLVYVPEGYYGTLGSYSYEIGNDVEGNDIFYRHPEWVLAWTRKDFTTVDQSNEVSLTSRLKRNLNSGDQIQMRVLLFNRASSGISITIGSPIIRGTVSYCCRAN